MRIREILFQDFRSFFDGAQDEFCGFVTREPLAITLRQGPSTGSRGTSGIGVSELPENERLAVRGW